jgi:hypothetical protein
MTIFILLLLGIAVYIVLVQSGLSGILFLCGGFLVFAAVVGFLCVFSAQIKES